MCNFCSLLTDFRLNGMTDAGAPVIVTYKFDDLSDDPTYRLTTPALQDAMRRAADEVARVAGVTMVEVPTASDAMINVVRIADPFGFSSAFYPSTDADNANSSADLRMHNAFTSADYAPGGDGYQVLLHEVGHTLGLKHPFEGFDTLPEDLDNTSNTLMSYNWVGGPYDTFQDFDIDALQTTYGGPEGVSGLRVRYNERADAVAVVGTSGADAIIGVNSGTRVLAKGGDDTLIGRDGSDRMLGGGGADDMTGNGANDLLVGGRGADTVVGGNGRDVLGGGGGADDLSGDDGDDKLFGGHGADALSGGRGADVLLGQGGDDALDGGRDDDVLFGQAGDDTLTGGPGADRFIIDGATGFEVITDFKPFRDVIDVRRADVSANAILSSAGVDGDDLVLAVGEAQLRLLNGADLTLVANDFLI